MNKKEQSKNIFQNPVVIAAIIGLIGTLIVGVLDFYGNLADTQIPIKATQTAEMALKATNNYLDSGIEETPKQVLTIIPSATVSSTNASDNVDAQTKKSVKIAVSNGTDNIGATDDLISWFVENEFNVTDIGSADSIYSKTTIYDYTGNPEIIDELVALLNTGSSYDRSDSMSDFDILIVLGNDWNDGKSLP